MPITPTAASVLALNANVDQATFLTWMEAVEVLVNANETAVAGEAAARTSADTALQTAITDETTARTSADSGLDTRVSALENATPAVAVEDDGASVVAAATALNFTGTGVTVTDGSNGKALVNIPGGGGGGGSAAENNAGLLINGQFQVANRANGSGAIAADTFFRDRWKSGPSGATISVAGETVTHTSGEIRTMLEAPNLASDTVVAVVEDLSGGNLNVTVGGVAGVITAGAGVQYVSIAVPGAQTGDVLVQLEPATVAVTYRRLRIMRGTTPGPFAPLPLALEHMACARYYIQNVDDGDFANLGVRYASFAWNANVVASQNIKFGNGPMARIPDMDMDTTTWEVFKNIAGADDWHNSFETTGSYVNGVSVIDLTVDSFMVNFFQQTVSFDLGFGTFLRGTWRADAEIF